MVGCGHRQQEGALLVECFDIVPDAPVQDQQVAGCVVGDVGEAGAVIGADAGAGDQANE